MTRAELFAKHFHASDGNHVHVYNDGVVLLVACNAERQQAIAALLKQWPVEQARTSVDSAVVFVVQHHFESLDDLGVIALLAGDGYVDRRNFPIRTLGHVESLLSKAE